MGKRNRRRLREVGQQVTPPRLDAELVERLLVDAVIAVRRGDTRALGAIVDILAAAWSATDALVPDTVDRCLRQAVEQLWSAGWQPADVARVVAKKLGPGHVRLVVGAIGADARRYLPGGAAPEWQIQLADIGAHPPGRKVKSSAVSHSRTRCRS